MIWNWDNKLRSATVGSDSISCKYAPDGSMVYKQSTIEGTDRKFIVDIVGRYPVILMELDPTNNNNIEKTYVHANGQVLMQHDGDTNANKHFYLHDRLGSVRQLIGTDGAVENHYTYDPFGQAFASETDETIANRFRFAGYKWDPVTGMYNCNARWYDPAIYRFTGRDPVKGSFREPLTLHAYLYCLNDSVNLIDPSGEIAGNIVSGVIMGSETYAIGLGLMIASIDVQGDNWRLSDALWFVGDWAISLTPVAVAYGLMNPYQIGKRKVSQWPGNSDSKWVMNGPKNAISYILSGKWLPTKKNQFAPYSSGMDFLIEEGTRTQWPRGFWGIFKGFAGQRIITP